MKRTVIFLYFLVTGLSFQVQARTFQGLSAGANAAYTNYSKLDFEGFAQANFQFRRTPFEPKLGISYRSFTTDYKWINDLGLESIGLFMEGDIYPFKKIFYTGLRFEIDLNWFNDKAMNTLESSGELVTEFFPGFRCYAVAGLDIPINGRISLRLSGMPGWQFYVLSDNWEVSTGGSSVNLTTHDGISYNRFVYQLNVGLAIRVWNR